jgi:cell division protein FtsI/penicillin-binding protein 2
MVGVAQPGGTAYSVYKGTVAWPSKTGSAEVAGATKTDAWFVGFAPAENPRVAFVFWVEEDGTGSGMAKNIGLVPLIRHALEATRR